MSSIPPKENDDEVILTDKSDADQIPPLPFVTGKSDADQVPKDSDLLFADKSDAQSESKIAGEGCAVPLFVAGKSDPKENEPEIPNDRSAAKESFMKKRPDAEVIAVRPRFDGGKEVQKVKGKTIHSFFRPLSDDVKKLSSTQACFKELLMLHEEMEVISIPTDSELMALKNMKITLDDLKRQATSTALSDHQLSIIYNGLEKLSGKFKATKEDVNSRSLCWKKVQSNVQLAKSAHTYHMNNDNFNVAASFQRIIIAGTRVIDRSTSALLASRSNSSKPTEDSGKDESMLNKNEATTEVVGGNQESCNIIAMNGQEQEIDSLFIPGTKHIASRKRKSRTTSKTISTTHPSTAATAKRSTTTTELCKSKSSFLAALQRFGLQNEAYQWSNDNNIICRCCNVHVPTARKMKQHSDGKKHIDKLNHWRKQKVRHESYSPCLNLPVLILLYICFNISR